MITLQEIAPYIPYNLKARLSQKGKFNLDSEYPNEYQNKIGQIKLWTIDNKGIGGILQVTDNYYFDFCEIDEIQIFMRPLSDLTSEIEHNGEKFKPVGKIEKELLMEGLLTFGLAEYGWVGFMSKDRKINIPIYMGSEIMPECGWGIMQMLFEWHLDVFGLIERGDAIDINTLPK